jgi:hypothetical protein
MMRVPWVAIAALFAALGIRMVTFLEPVSGLLPECGFKRLTGIACVTCGLTRSVLAMGRGDWPMAFHWHPAAALLLVLVPVVAAWDVRRAWRGDSYPSLPDSQMARCSVWVFLAVVWALQVARGI